MSSSSQAARGSPSRGWPTLPGLSSQRPSPRSSFSPSSAWPPRVSPGPPSSGPGEEERDVRVADQRQPLRLDLHAGVRLLDREHVLPDRVAGRGVEEADALALQAVGLELARNSSVALADLVPGPLDRLRRGLREGGDVELAEHREVVVADQAERRSARGPGRCRRPGRRRSRPRRRGTRSPRPGASRRSARTASSAGRLAWMSVITATRKAAQRTRPPLSSYDGPDEA